MTTKDYQHVLKTSALVEKQVIRLISQVCDISKVRRQLFIPVDCYVLDRYIEVVWLGNVEVMTIEVSGRTASLMPLGYREA